MKRLLLSIVVLMAMPLSAQSAQFEGYERVLLPIFTTPVFGAHGSDFRTDFHIMNTSTSELTVNGLLRDCIILCPDDPVMAFPLGGRAVDNDEIMRTGDPGAFMFIPPGRSNDVAMQLRVYDVSRETTNFGTEIPIVRGGDMRPDEITLTGVPTDPRFRLTLRIYSTEEQPMHVYVEAGNGILLAEKMVFLSPPTDVFDPAYGVLTDFPVGVGPVHVRVASAMPDIITGPTPIPDFWAFLTVTNNDTQHITVISPQR